MFDQIEFWGGWKLLTPADYGLQLPRTAFNFNGLINLSTNLVRSNKGLHN